MTAAGKTADRATRLGLVQLSLYCWLLYSVGPVTLLLRDELMLGRAAAAAHSTAMAVGFTVAGLVSRHLLLHIPEAAVRRGALLGLCLGAVSLSVSRTLPWTLTSVLVCGFSGAVLVNALNHGIAVHHGPRSARALAGINAFAASVGVSAPLLIGLAVENQLSWRLLIAVLAALTAVTAVVGRAGFSSEGIHGDAPSEMPASLPRYRACVMTLLAGMVIEFTTALFASDAVRTQSGVATGTATAVAACFMAGFAAGRWCAAHVVRRISAPHIMVAAFILCAAGATTVTQASTAAVVGAGLAVLGLGCGPAYPLLVAEALRYAPQGAVHAVSRIGVLSGLVIGLAPFALGRLADIPALGIPFIFFVICGTSLAAAGSLYRLFPYASTRAGSRESTSHS